MMRFTVCLIVGMLLITPSAARAQSRPQRPNILFVLIDDMGYGDLSCFGGTRVKTPAIDKLAAEGTRFTQFYVNAPICSPSRVAFTTGQYPNRWHITSFLARRDEDAKRGIADWLDPKAPTLAKVLQQNGYHTAHVGKWHMGGQRDVGDAPAITSYGFDTSLTNFEGLGPRILPILENMKLDPAEMSGKFGGPGAQWVEQHKVTEKFVDRAIVEMDAATSAGKPFYINLWPTDVHSPCQAPPGMRGDGSPAANYLGVLRELDRQLDRAFEHIRSNPALRDNTIIILCSDNGPELGLGVTGGLRGGKGQLYEGGIRSPLIVWSPALVKAGVTDEKTVLAGMDIPASLLTITGLAMPSNVALDGIDMSSALTGKSTPPQDRPIMWVRPPDRPGPKNGLPDLAIRQGQWKLLVKRDSSRPELFDIDSDPKEKTNLADKQPDLAKKLADQVIAWDASIK